MKTFKILIVLFASAFLFSCDNESDEPQASLEIPEKFTVDIPSTLSSSADGSLSGKSGGPLNGRVAGDGDGYIEGNEIYESLRYFIRIGEGSAEIIEFTLQVATALEVQNVNSLSFTSDEDGRDKRLEIIRDVNRGGVDYEYEMTMFDEEDNAQALQLLWNTSPIEGVGILNFYHINRNESDNPNAFIRIDYTEDDVDYEAAMTVSISGLLTPNNGDVNNMKMKVGKNGDVVEIMGNSNHPDVAIIDENNPLSRNYAFTGRGDEVSDLGVVNLALPPSTVTTSDVLSDYSVFAVLEAEIQAAGVTDQEIIDEILQEAHSPAYFNAAGFITSGADNKPASFSDEFVDISDLNPFVPADVANLSVGFIQ